MGLIGSLTGGGVCSDCRRKEQEKRLVAQENYKAVLNGLAIGDQLLPAIAGAIPELEAGAAFTPAELVKVRNEAFLAYANRILADDVLSAAEEEEFLSISPLFGISNLQSQFPDIMSRMLVAKCNDGRLSAIEDPILLPKRNETVHLETNASLMKERVVREYRGGSSGVSFRVMKGVSYRVGASRGKMVQTGTEIVVEDSGTLSVTSQRAVFMGEKSTVEIPYAKLAGLNLFSDGIRFNISNRKTAPLLKLESPGAVAAVMNTAIQRLD
jgi:hypothetical protein